MGFWRRSVPSRVASGYHPTEGVPWHNSQAGTATAPADPTRTADLATPRRGPPSEPRDRTHQAATRGRATPADVRNRPSDAGIPPMPPTPRAAPPAPRVAGAGRATPRHPRRARRCARGARRTGHREDRPDRPRPGGIGPPGTAGRRRRVRVGTRVRGTPPAVHPGPVPAGTPAATAT